MKPRQQIMVTDADDGTVNEGFHRAMEARGHAPEFKPPALPIENYLMLD